jgi:ribosomal protein S18 acetylase RimI-like enzyme
MVATSQTGDTVTPLDDDAKRFQAWQRDALEARPSGTQLLTVGPFRILIPPDRHSGWMTLVEGRPTERETTDAVARLRSAKPGRSSELEVEYDETAFPQVGTWLKAAGLTLERRDPLMACRPGRFRPFTANDVVQRRLTPASAPGDLEVFQAIRWTNGGELDHAAPPIDRLRKELASADSFYLLAWLDGERAGTGVSHSLKGAAEVVGVVTRADKRRRGVAAAVTSTLVTEHFAGGGDFVFLDAANESAARVYERLGFTRFGTNCVYVGERPA